MHTKSTYRSFSQIFSPASFKKAFREDSSSMLQRKLKRYDSDNSSATNGHIIQKLYSELKDNYRNEYLYKNALLNDLILRKYSIDTTTVFNEFKIGSSVADFVLLNGEIKIFEVKTELDKLDKLEKQIEDYCQFADKVIVVADAKHITKLMNLYSATTIGIVELTEQGKLKTFKEAQNNSLKFNHETIFKTLRKGEYLNIIEDYFGEIPDVPNTKIFKECLEISKKINILDFQKLVLKTLKQRKIKTPDMLINAPYELKHICYSLDFTYKEYAKMYNFLNKVV